MTFYSFEVNKKVREMSDHQGQEALLTGAQGGLWGVKWCGNGWRGARPKGPVEIGMRNNKGLKRKREIGVFRGA